MPFNPRHHLRPLSSLLLSAALGCSGPAPEQDSSPALASEAQGLSRPGLPPGLAPSRVKDIQVGADTSLNPTGRGSFFLEAPAPVSLGSTLYFTAFEESTGLELWRTDGTHEGTQLVRELIPGSDSQGYMRGLTGLVSTGNSLFLSTTSPTIGGALWKSDGTPEGTVRVDSQGR